MARIFLRLKWALIVNGVRHHPWGIANAAGILIVLVALGGLAGLGVALMGRADLDAWLPLVLTLLFVSWMVLPVALFGVDETLDPARLASLPLVPRDLMTGLLVASALSAGGGATTLFLLGVVVGFADGLATVVIVAAVAVQLALCLAVGRTVTTLFSRMLGSRRGRDLVTTLVFMLSFAFFGLFQLPSLLLPRLGRSGAGGFTLDPTNALPVLRFTPPGQVGLAIVHARAGTYGQAMLALVLALVWTVLLVGAWWWGLQHLSRRSHDRGDAGRVRSRLVPWPLRPLLPSNRRTAVAARELRYLVREPVRRIRLAQNLMAFVPLVMLPMISGSVGLQDPRLVLLGGLAPLLLINETGVQLGSDGRALWAHVATPGSWRDDLQGRNLATLVVGLAVAVAAAVGLASFTDGWHHVVLVPPLAVGAWGIAAGLGNVLAVRLPIPVPEPEQGNLFGGNAGGDGCLFGLASFGTLLACGVVAAPVWVAAWRLHDRPMILVLVSMVGATYGAVVWHVGTTLAARFADTRQDELLEIVSRAR